jgi:hypothetical protein
MKHLLVLLVSLALTPSVNAAAAKSKNDGARAAQHSAVVDMPKVIDLSRVDPTTWPVPAVSPTSPSGKGWRYFEENRVAGE